MTIGRYLSQGWEVVKGNFGTVWLGTFLLALVNSFIPIFSGPMIAANAHGTLKALRGESTDLGEIMSAGFAKPAAYIFGGLLIAILFAISAALCLVPALFVVPMLWYSVPAMVDRGCSFGESLSISKELWVKGGIGQHVLFVFAIIGVILLGVLACGIGVLVSTVVAYSAIVAAYRDLSGDRTAAATPSSTS